MAATTPEHNSRIIIISAPYFRPMNAPPPVDVLLTLPEQTPLLVALSESVQPS